MTLADKLAIAFACMLLPYLYINLWGNNSQGERVLIQVAEQAPMILPLDYNKRLEIEGRLGISIIEIKDRQVRFIDSPCQSKRCVIEGWLGQDHETTACMPNGVSLQIIGKDARFDAMNF